jgi:alginate O-acetyltransferase complex protein AlgI
MLFQSVGFLFIFLPIFLIFLKIAPKGTPKSICILCFSYLFYSGSEPFFLIILGFSSLLDYFVALALDRAQTTGRRRIFLIFSVIANLGLLGFYKYGGMVLPHLNPILNMFGLGTFAPEFFKSFVLPAGISFYTFQSMSYTIDVYRGFIKPERSIIGYANYVAYLPQLIAGPIERFGHLHSQLQKMVQGETVPHWSAGFDRISVGIIEKLFIADSCGLIVDTLLRSGGPYNLWTGWAIATGFGMQILFDFAGYTHMAIGISMLLGVELTENFLSPYKSRNIQDFWRRWHVTLSSWFRDYLYIPLGGSRRGLGRTVFNILVTFTLCGLWHGAGWNYVAWGAAHGLLLAVFHIVSSKFPKFTLPRPLGVFLTFAAVHFMWILFRVNDPQQVTLIWQAMVGMNGLTVGEVSIFDLVFLVGVALFSVLSPNAAERWPGRSGPLESVSLWALALLAVFSSPQINQFIYFQF